MSDQFIWSDIRATADDEPAKRANTTAARPSLDGEGERQKRVDGARARAHGVLAR